MSASTSVAVVYRTLQSIRDLRSVAEGASDTTLARITAGTSVGDAETRLRRAVFEDGCRLLGADVKDLHLALVLAATLPDDDHDAFVAATAILLADRLQHGGGIDDMFWHWDAFHAHYRLVQAPSRAAIMNGYRRAHEDGRVRLEDPPHGADLCTEAHRDAVAALRALGEPASRDVLERALLGGELDPAIGWWEADGSRHVMDRNTPLLRVVRHIHESEPAWRPFGDRTFDPDTSDVPILPFPQG